MNRPTIALALLLAVPAAVDGQVAAGGPDTTSVEVDATDPTSIARAAQARFEYRRIRHLPTRWGSARGGCDEEVGRFCTWYDRSDWYPEEPEAPEIGALRAELLTTLDSVWAVGPGDDWVLGQRVWYRAEGGDWPAALTTARDCAGAATWWCAALEGFALHGLGRYRDAEAAFERSLDGMEPNRAEKWRRPVDAVDNEARRVLRGLNEAPPDSVARVLDRLWLLADPLYLVDGNDRLTAHYARWAQSTLRERARNAFGLSWGADLEELTVRNGWEVAWERVRIQGSITAESQIVAHKHPEGRDYMPSGRALKASTRAQPEDLTPDLGRPRSLYAPDYAPLLLPLEGQLAVFPRGGRLAMVATHFVPPDTSRHVEHEHPRPWLEPGDQEGMPDEAGLFLVPESGDPIGVLATGESEGALIAHAPAGAYVVSVEAWSPEQRRAGRLRRGLEVVPVPDDVATLSDILLLDANGGEVFDLSSAVPRVLPRPQIHPGQTFAIVWEVAGLGFRRETLVFEVSVTRSGRNTLERFTDFLRITRRPEPLELSWEEPSPDQPGVLFRYLELDLPPLDPGEYEVELTLKTDGRADVTTTAPFTVLDPTR